MIEVEFVHLAGLDNQLGQLTLLDTLGQTKPGSPTCKNVERAVSPRLRRAGGDGLYTA